MAPEEAAKRPIQSPKPPWAFRPLQRGFRIGEIQIEVYVVGKTASGAWAGMGAFDRAPPIYIPPPPASRRPPGLIYYEVPQVGV